MTGEIRRAAVAGCFYPADAKDLSRQIREYLSAVPRQEIGGELLALIVPHAGYIYSGPVAACAYRLLERKKFESVVVVAPSHRAFFTGASIYDCAGYETPLGVVELDGESCRRLCGSSVFRSMARGHEQEHSLEVQLPFLQETIGPFRLVPIVIGDQSFATCSAVGQAIARELRGKKVLLVASTDLSHFHAYEKAVQLDRLFLDQLSLLDPCQLANDLAGGSLEACGGGPVVAVMTAALEWGADSVRIMNYANSGDITGDRSGVVGYAAAAICRLRPEKKVGGRTKGGIGLELSEEQKTLLRRIARGAVESRMKDEEAPAPEVTGAVLNEPRGAFVCWKRRGQLRGCIGQIQTTQPLYKTIQQMAMAAALDDPRFPPMSARDLLDMQLEISVLSPLKRIRDISEIEVGRHGLYIKKGYCSGLLLPQVATECRWERLKFLEETCFKAGLPRDTWKHQGTEIYIFSADVF